MTVYFKSFQYECLEQYWIFGKRSSLARCSLLPYKKECNEKNCPLYKQSDLGGHSTTITNK